MGEQEWTPAFPGQRPPFQPGHELSITHGVYSPRRVEPLAQAFVDVVLADQTLTHLHGSAFRPALWALGRAEAKCQLLEEYLARRAEATGDGVGDLDEGRVQSAYRELHRAESRAMTLRTQLGMTPLAAARLGKDWAQGKAADAAAALTEAREAAERRARGEGDSDDD